MITTVRSVAASLLNARHYQPAVVAGFSRLRILASSREPLCPHFVSTERVTQANRCEGPLRRCASPRLRSPMRIPLGARTALRTIWLIIFLVGSVTPAVGQTQPEREIAESQRRLEQIRRERAQLREEMTRIRTRVSDLSG